jgi:enterochelin esterase-like enzyme
MGSLVVIGKSFIAGLAALAAAGWLGWLVLRRHHRLTAIPFAVVASLLTLATAADLVNAHYGYLPRVDDVVGRPSWPTVSFRDVEATATSTGRLRSFPDGSVTTLRIAGPRSGFGGHRVMIYLPPAYFTDPGRRFPVVYLLHGTPGAPIDWFRATRAAQTGARLAAGGRPAILVAPQVSRGWLDDSECVDRPSEHIETYLINDVIPAIDQRLRTLPTRADRIFAGMSAGGFCALNLGLRHRDVVATIVDLSGFDQPTHSGGMVGLFGHQSNLPALVSANDPARYAASLPAVPPMRIWLDCGRADRTALADQRRIALLLSGRGYSVILRLRAGGHDYDVWRPALRDGLTWAVPTNHISERDNA